jgi:hypothetical protein
VHLFVEQYTLSRCFIPNAFGWVIRASREIHICIGLILAGFSLTIARSNSVGLSSINYLG